jgi:ubiquinone/menaquinone biosynthesis C-methylase UbiE
LDPARPSYGSVAWCYEQIAASYSGGAIPAAKASQMSELARGDRVLYVGVGCGEDALLAARRGVELACLDVSDRMLARCEDRLRTEGLRAELHCESLFDHDRRAAYDVVAANFVLNVFPQALMRTALAQIATFLRPGGRLLIADFAPADGAGLDPLLARAYYRPVNLAAWMLRLCSLHPLYDYAADLQGAGLGLVRRERFRVFGRGPAWFESLVASKPPQG